GGGDEAGPSGGRSQPAAGAAGGGRAYGPTAHVRGALPASGRRRGAQHTRALLRRGLLLRGLLPHQRRGSARAAAARRRRTLHLGVTGIASRNTVLVDEPRPGVVLVTLNRPERLHAMNHELVGDLHAVLDQV